MSAVLSIPATLPTTKLPTSRPARSRHTLGWCGVAGSGLLAAALFAIALLDPFAPENTHAPPEMLAAWEEMMRDG